jgi:hypothetical protein
MMIQLFSMPTMKLLMERKVLGETYISCSQDFMHVLVTKCTEKHLLLYRMKDYMASKDEDFLLDIDHTKKEMVRGTPVQ